MTTFFGTQGVTDIDFCGDIISAFFLRINVRSLLKLLSFFD